MVCEQDRLEFLDTRKLSSIWQFTRCVDDGIVVVWKK